MFFADIIALDIDCDMIAWAIIIFPLKTKRVIKFLALNTKHLINLKKKMVFYAIDLESMDLTELLNCFATDLFFWKTIHFC